MKELPVTVLTGFLGAGKTTLLRRLLAQPHGLQIGLVVNELGPAGIDAAEPGRSAYVELTEGCACCLRNPDLLAAISELHARGDLDRIVVETTGLADPLALTWVLQREELRGKARLDAVVTVVDAQSFELERSEEWEAQVRCADLVVLAKLDVAGAGAEERARAAVAALRPEARVLRGTEELPLSVLLEAEPLGGIEPREVGRHSGFGVVPVAGRERYDADRLEDLLEALPREVFRAKGVVWVGGERWVRFHVVAGRVHLELEAREPAHGESRLVFFGRELDAVALAGRVAACRA